MIVVQLNKEGFENDIHSLVKAFYPSENVSVYAGNGGKKAAEPVHLRMEVDYKANEVGFVLKEPAAEPEAGFGQWHVVQRAVFAVDFSDRKEARNLLKLHLYRIFSAYSGRTLPWGTLTGVRPVKIPMTMLQKGSTETEIQDYMEQAYAASKEKINLSMDIAKRELELLSKLDYKKGYSLYIGIPFCPSTCLYCSFTSYPITMWEERINDYLDALDKEIGFTSDCMAERYLNSIYIGGGTPTTLSPKQLDRLLTKIRQSFAFTHLLEFTVEAGRPDSITREKLEVLRAHGISRISINPQTMKQETLDLIGRRHTVRQTVESFYLARELGFDNINMDLIMGLPQESLDDAKRTMAAVKKLGPDNITVHSLAVKRAARLSMYKEDYAGLEMVNTQEHLDAAASVCDEMGMRPYYLYRQKNMAGNFENVGYAKAGKAGVYNILIMEEVQDIVACGAGTISKRVYPDGQIERCENVKDVAQYIGRIEEMIERKRVLFGS